MTPADESRATGRIPPQDLAAEQCVLGSILADNSTADVLALCPPGAFYFTSNQTVAHAIVEMRKIGTPVDLVTLVAFLREKSALDQAGGSAWLASLTNHASFSPANVEHYARIVRDKAQLRALILAANAAILRASEGGAVDEVLAELGKALRETDSLSEAGWTSARDVADDLIRELADMARTGKARSFATGVPALDRTFWIKPTDLFVFGGPPASGKSFAAQQISVAVAMTGRGVAFLSAEMPPADVLARGARTFDKLDHDVFREPSGRDQSFRAAQAVDRMGRLPIFYSIETRLEPMLRGLRQKARRGEISCVIVDFLQRLQIPESRPNEAERLGYASRALKQFALQERVPVFLLSSMNRGGYTKGERPTMGSLRGSGDIESDADTVVLLHQLENGLVEWIVGKARETAGGRGGTGEVAILMRRNFSRGGFEEDSPEKIERASPKAADDEAVGF